MANHQCKECGCSSDEDVHLHAEIEQLKNRIAEKDVQIVTMETHFLNEANKFPSGQLLAMHDELMTWQDKYKRLHDAHRRVQRVNQGLEDKLLRLVDVSETDKSTLTKDVATLSVQLADANFVIKKLRADNERYKNDVSLAVQFLQCKPANFVSHRVDTLPSEVQAKVSTYMGREERRTPPTAAKSIKVPIATFPPTAMVYSVPKMQQLPASPPPAPQPPPVHIVSAAIMAKVLEERERERSGVKHCDTCTCSMEIQRHDIATQTLQEENCGAITHHDVQMAKVQPNNFLLNNNKQETAGNGATSGETIYFANERAQKAIKVTQIHSQPAFASTSCTSLPFMPTLHKTLSLSGGEKESEAVPDKLDASRYRAMEEHVKKFLFGEFTILGDVKRDSFE